MSIFDIKKWILDIKNSFFDIKNSCLIFDIKNSFFDIKNSIFDIKKGILDIKNYTNFWYQKFEFLISRIRILDIKNSNSWYQKSRHFWYQEFRHCIDFPPKCVLQQYVRQGVTCDFIVQISSIYIYEFVLYNKIENEMYIIKNLVCFLKVRKDSVHTKINRKK